MHLASSKKKKTILNSFSIAILIKLSCYFPSNTTTKKIIGQKYASVPLALATRVARIATTSLRDPPSNLTKKTKHTNNHTNSHK